MSEGEGVGFKINIVTKAEKDAKAAAQQAATELAAANTATELAAANTAAANTAAANTGEMVLQIKEARAAAAEEAGKARVAAAEKAGNARAAAAEAEERAGKAELKAAEAGKKALEERAVAVEAGKKAAAAKEEERAAAKEEERAVYAASNRKQIKPMSKELLELASPVKGGGNKKTKESDKYTVKQLKTLAFVYNVKSTKKSYGKIVNLKSDELLTKLKKSKIIL